MTRPRNPQAKAWATRRNVPQAPGLPPRGQWQRWWANTLRMVDNPHVRRNAEEYGQGAALDRLIEALRELTA